MCSYKEICAISLYFWVILCFCYVNHSWADVSPGTIDEDATEMFNSGVKRQLSGEKIRCSLNTGASIEIDPEQVIKSSPFCYTYGCSNGKITANPAGCLADDKCHPLWSEYFANDCGRYECQPRYTYPQGYDSVLKEKLCSDWYGNCHKPGEMFDFQIIGVLYGNCTCVVENYRVDNIRCFGKRI